MYVCTVLQWMTVVIGEMPTWLNWFLNIKVRCFIMFRTFWGWKNKNPIIFWNSHIVAVVVIWVPIQGLPQKEIIWSSNRWNSNMFEKFFRVETIDNYVKYWKFWNLDPFCDVIDPQKDPKWSKITYNARKLNKMIVWI